MTKPLHPTSKYPIVPRAAHTNVPFTMRGEFSPSKTFKRKKRLLHSHWDMNSFGAPNEHLCNTFPRENGGFWGKHGSIGR